MKTAISNIEGFSTEEFWNGPVVRKARALIPEKNITQSVQGEMIIAVAAVITQTPMATAGGKNPLVNSPVAGVWLQRKTTYPKIKYYVYSSQTADQENTSIKTRFPKSTKNITSNLFL